MDPVQSMVHQADGYHGEFDAQVRVVCLSTGGLEISVRDQLRQRQQITGALGEAES
jgi:hypothetical protein